MWFYNKFKCTDITELRNNNPVHTFILGKTCYLAYFRVGERGLFLYESDYSYEIEKFHRIYTSIVQGVITIEDNTIVVTTENCVYTFEMIEE